MKVVCVSLIGSDGRKLEQDSWLTVGREYVVLGVYGRGSTIKYRLIGDDESTPALHRAEQFDIKSNTIPADWSFKLYPETFEWMIEPSVLAADGFWTAYFDGDSAARSTFDNVVLALAARP